MYLFECFFSVKIAWPSEVVDMTASFVAKEKKEKPKKWKGATVHKCSCKDEWSKKYPIMRADGN